MPSPEPGTGGRRRLPCERCGGSRECDEDAQDLWATVDGEKTRVCVECREELRNRTLRPELQPTLRVSPDSPLAASFAEIDEELEAEPEGMAWR